MEYIKKSYSLSVCTNCLNVNDYVYFIRPAKTDEEIALCENCMKEIAEYYHKNIESKK